MGSNFLRSERTARSAPKCEWDPIAVDVVARKAAATCETWKWQPIEHFLLWILIKLNVIWFIAAEQCESDEIIWLLTEREERHSSNRPSTSPRPTSVSEERRAISQPINSNKYISRYYWEITFAVLYSPHSRSVVLWSEFNGRTAAGSNSFLLVPANREIKSENANCGFNSPVDSGKRKRVIVEFELKSAFSRIPVKCRAATRSCSDSTESVPDRLFIENMFVFIFRLKTHFHSEFDSERCLWRCRSDASNAIARLARRRTWFSRRRSICAERSIYCRNTANRKTNNAAENFEWKMLSSPTLRPQQRFRRIELDQTKAKRISMWNMGQQRSLLFPHVDKSVARSTLGGQNGRMMKTDETKMRALNRRRHNSRNEENIVRTKLCLDEQFSYNGRSFRFSFSPSFFITVPRSLREIKPCFKLFEITRSTICFSPGWSPNVN